MKRIITDAQKANSKVVRNTVKNFISRTYAAQLTRSKLRGHKPPDYSKEELRKFILSYPGFRKLWRNWKKSEQDRMLVPSCDRLDDNIGYTLSNLQIVTWSENCRKKRNKSERSYSNPTDRSRRPTRGVMQYDISGEFIAEYYSAREAAEALGLKSKGHIGSSCAGNKKSYCGFIWKYKKDFI